MPGENLSQLEATARANLISVDAYEINLDLTFSGDHFETTTKIFFSSSETNVDTFLDFIGPNVDRVILNGQEFSGTDVFADSRIELRNLKEKNEVEIFATAAYTNTGEGLHKFVDPVDNETYLYSQFEVPDSRRVFPVFEQPDLKATFTFTVKAPAHWTVVSNSPVAQVNEASSEHKLWSFAPTGRISSYITAIIAGPYVSEKSSLKSIDGRIIDLGLYARASLVKHLDANYIFDITKAGFKFYEESFGVAYPFEKYDQLFVPEFNAGAMENAGAVTFTETYVFRSQVTDAVRERRVVTILHELAHMWFGDLVTMKWWNDLWLNESFAEWASTLATAQATEWKEAWTTFAVAEKAWAYRQDQLPSTHPVVAQINDLEDVLVNFDGITYAKGGSVLKQLVAWVGLDNFLAGLKAYFTKHAWSNTTLDDLLVELEKTSGRELQSWSQQWLQTSGVNLLRPIIKRAENGVITSLSIAQEEDKSDRILRPHRLGVGFYNFDATGALVRTFGVEQDIAGGETEVSGLPADLRADLVLLNDQDLTYAKIRFDEVSGRTVETSLRKVSDPLARSLLWAALWDATRDGELDGQTYVQIVLDNILFETHSTVIRTTLAQLQTTVKLYLPTQIRLQVRQSVADALWQLSNQADPGSDAQFQFIKAFAQLVSSAQHGLNLRGLLNGEIEIAGLNMDTDLRWNLLEGLAILGLTDQYEVEQFKEQDRTANGNQQAATVGAAIASADAKAETFQLLLSPNPPTNALTRSLVLGFNNVVDPKILEPLVQPYFDSITKIWEERSYHIAETVIEGLYPWPLAGPELIASTEAWLQENPAAPVALRRLVVEQLAAVQRAINAQRAVSITQ